MSLPEETGYWDKQWQERTKTEVVSRNRGKFSKIISELWKRPHYSKLTKLDIGCGPAEHAYEMKKLYCDWVVDYTGLELSQVCVNKALEKFNIVIAKKDIYNYTSTFNYGLFLLLDTLEHIEFPDKLAMKIKELSTEKFYIFGNVPLYPSDPSADGGFEKPMDIRDISKFVSQCGCKKLWYEVYGINGYPYLIWEGKT